MKRHETILQRDQTILLIVDYQEKFIRVMPHHETVTNEIVKLLKAMKQFGIPTIATEQYPKGLGPTIPVIKNSLAEENISDKMTFSCCGDEKFWEHIARYNRNQIIVTGIETHVCVLQTVLDLIANEYQVHIPITTTCSRNDSNRDIAFERMRQAGAIITNTESILFELLTKAGTDEFKIIQKLIV